MGYWKIQADRLFDGEKMYTGPASPVLVGKPSGEIEALIPPGEAGDDVRRYEGLLCPGFVNTHCHLELSHMAGVIPEGTGLVDFLLQVMGRRGEIAKDPLEAARQADRRMYEEGIVAIGDVSNNISTLPIKAASPLYYHTFVEVMGFLPAAADARLAQARQVYDAARRIMGQESASLVAHAPYSVSQPLFEALNRATAAGIFSIHNQESEAEDQLYREGGGDFLRLYATLGQNLDFFSPTHQSSLATYLPWMTSPSTLLLVHNTVSTPGDVQLALALTRERNQSLYWCLCPGANLYIQRILPPVALLRDQGCSITLGTDSLASNHQLSILSEIKILQDNFPSVPLDEILRWATLNGAKSLGLDRRFGRLIPGAQPGILLIDGLENAKIGENTRVRRLY